MRTARKPDFRQNLVNIHLRLQYAHQPCRITREDLCNLLQDKNLIFIDMVCRMIDHMACHLACSLACNMTGHLANGVPVIQVGQDCEECRTGRSELRSY